jgi:CHRD domain
LTRTKQSVFGGALLAGLFFAAMAGAAEQRYETRLTAAPYDGAMRANVQGDGSVRANLEGSKLTVSGTFTGLPSSATTAKLYSGPAIGVPGPAILDLQLAGQRDGALSGSFALTSKQAAALKLGHVYVQLNSEKAPDGNLQGWLLPEHPFPGVNVPEQGHGFLPQLDVPGNWTQK